LADAGFDGKEVWEALRREGLQPVIRLRGGGEARMEARVRAREGWDPEVGCGPPRLDADFGVG